MKDPKQAFLDHLEREWREKAPQAAVWTFNARDVLDAVGKQLNPQTPEDIAAIFTAWHDLYRSGIVNYGWVLTKEQQRSDDWSYGLPAAHITKHGKKVLEHVRRDPSNPAAYLAHVDAVVPVGSVARSYLDEALATYGAGCDKATTVLAGCASEALVLELRDAARAKYDGASKSRPVGLRDKDWTMKSIIDGLQDILDATKAAMPNELRERFEYRWSFVTDVIRRARNDVGHPTDPRPVGRDDIHALLLMFPEVAKLTRDLITWVTTSFTP